VDEAIATNNYSLLFSIFNPSLSSTTSSPSWEQLGQGEQRSLSSYIIKACISSPTFLTTALANKTTDDTDQTILTLLLKCLNHLPPTVEKAMDNQLRNILFQYYVDVECDYRTAAQVLAGMRMEGEDTNSVYYTSPVEMTDVYVKIAECFLEEDDAVEADSFVTKAGTSVELIGRCSGTDDDGEEERKKHVPLILRYKSTYARVLDSNRRFLQAAGRYHELSQFGMTDGNVDGEQDKKAREDDDQCKSVVVNPNDLLEFLGRAATCAILAPSSPQCQRVLGLIFKDERLSQLDTLAHFETHSAILTKMYMNQVIRHDNDLSTFEKSLCDHQRAIMSDGLTIIQRAIIEHNMVAVSHLYHTIYFDELGVLLDVSNERAETVAAKMIVDGSLKGGSIDQVEGMLVFDNMSNGEVEGYSSGSMSRGGSGSQSLVAWDEAITSFCVQLNRVTDAIRA